MRKTLILLILTFILSGCATYKFQKSTSGSQGYLACYDGYPLPEYTIGKENSLPDLALAKERFKRRRLTVELYYKQMDKIETRLKEFLWEPPAMVVDFLGGVLRWPFIAAADYKYNHNPKYKAKMDKLDEEKDALETARVNNLKKELDAYIARDLAEESGGPGVVEKALTKSQPEPKVSPQVQEKAPETEAPSVVSRPAAQVVPQVAPEPIPRAVPEAKSIKEEPTATPAAETVAPVAAPPAEIKPAAVKEAPAAKRISEPPVAVITAKPVKGYSPLKVNFSGKKSFSKSGRIVDYLWDFGDGDTSTKKNSENTYWSTTFGSRSFTVTLTVKDETGATSSATSVIEVITR